MVITSPTHSLVFTVPCLRLVLPQSAAVLQDHMDVGCPARKRKKYSHKEDQKSHYIAHIAEMSGLLLSRT